MIGRWRTWRKTPRSRDRVIVTAEGLALPVVLAARGTRLAALMIDLVLIVLAIIGVTTLMGFVARGAGIDRGHAGPAADAVVGTIVVIWIIVIFLSRSAWFLWFELGPRGATPGKRLTGLRIAARPGRDGVATRLSAEAVIARNLLRDIELFLPVVFIGGAINAGSDTTIAIWVSVLWLAIFAGFPLLNRDGLRCGDVIAGTWVVEAPRRRLGAALSLGEGAQGISTVTGARYRFSDADLAVYGEYELKVLERVLRDNQPKALVEVAATICTKIGWTSGTGDERAFLEAYYTQLRARLETGMRLGRRKADKFAR